MGEGDSLEAAAPSVRPRGLASFLRLLSKGGADAPGL